MALAGLAGLSTVGESAIDHPFYLLGGFLFLWRLSIISWMVVSLSSSIVYSVSSFSAL